MPHSKSVKSRLAESLLRQRQPEQRKKLIIKYLIALILLFIAHSFFSNLDTPLKLIPQTMAAISMGYVIFLLSAIKQFGHVVDFIDWEKVTSHTEQAD